MVKITDVAERAGVAKSTVSNVLSGRKFVSEELRIKVLNACHELDFQPNFYASGLSSSGKSNILALLLEATPEIVKYPFYKDLIMSCLLRSAENGYSLLVYYDTDNAKLLKMLRQGRSPIGGAIMLAPNVNDERLAEMESNRTVCVVVGRPSISDISYVDVDNKKLVTTVAEKLIESYGTDVYLINSEGHTTISQDRAAAFREVCDRHAIDFSTHHYQCQHDTVAEAYQFAINHVKKDAVFITANETRARGVYQAVEEKGLQVGKDVGVFALGRSIEHGTFSPKLSYAFQSYDRIGQLAVKALIHEIETGEKSAQLIESDMIFRDSTQR